MLYMRPLSSARLYTSGTWYRAWHVLLYHLLEIDIDGAAAQVDQSALNAGKFFLFGIKTIGTHEGVSSAANWLGGATWMSKGNQLVSFYLSERCTYQELPPTPMTLRGLQLTMKIQIVSIVTSFDFFLYLLPMIAVIGSRTTPNRPRRLPRPSELACFHQSTG